MFLANKNPNYVTLSNAYAQLPEFAADPPQSGPTSPQNSSNSDDETTSTLSEQNVAKGSNPKKNQGLKNSPKEAKNSPKPIPSCFKRKAISCFLVRQFQRTKDAQENIFLMNTSHGLKMNAQP